MSKSMFQGDGNLPVQGSLCKTFYRVESVKQLSDILRLYLKGGKEVGFPRSNFQRPSIWWGILWRNFQTSLSFSGGWGIMKQHSFSSFSFIGRGFYEETFRHPQVLFGGVTQSNCQTSSSFIGAGEILHKPPNVETPGGISGLLQDFDNIFVPYCSARCITVFQTEHHCLSFLN